MRRLKYEKVNEVVRPTTEYGAQTEGRQVILKAHMGFSQMKGLLRGLKGKQLSKSLKKTFLIATLELK
jgi:hypothetical protein